MSDLTPSDWALAVSGAPTHRLLRGRWYMNPEEVNVSARIAHSVLLAANFFEFATQHAGERYRFCIFLLVMSLLGHGLEWLSAKAPGCGHVPPGAGPQFEAAARPKALRRILWLASNSFFVYVVVMLLPRPYVVPLCVYYYICHDMRKADGILGSEQLQLCERRTAAVRLCVGIVFRDVVAFATMNTIAVTHREVVQNAIVAAYVACTFTMMVTTARSAYRLVHKAHSDLEAADADADAGRTWDASALESLAMYLDGPLAMRSAARLDALVAVLVALDPRRLCSLCRPHVRGVSVVPLQAPRPYPRPYPVLSVSVGSSTSSLASTTPLTLSPTTSSPSPPPLPPHPDCPAQHGAAWVTLPPHEPDSMRTGWLDLTTAEALRPPRTPSLFKDVFDAFMCHVSRESKPIVRVASAALLSVGIKCFVDEKDLPGSPTKAIAYALSDMSTVMIGWLTPGFPDSKWCKIEAKHHLERRARFIPFMLGVDPEKVPRAMKELIGHVLPLPASGADLQEQLEALVQSVHLLVVRRALDSGRAAEVVRAARTEYRKRPRDDPRLVELVKDGIALSAAEA